MAILQLTDERVPSEIGRVSQQELTFIAEFLHGFEKTVPGADGRRMVNLEKLGQYLRQENLQTRLTSDGSEWAALLDENRCLHDYEHIVKQDFNLSLLQSHAKLVDAIQKVFAEAYQSLVDHFTMTSIAWPSFAFPISTQIVATDGNLLLATSTAGIKFFTLFKIKYSPTEPMSLDLRITVDVDRIMGWYILRIN